MKRGTKVLGLWALGAAVSAFALGACTDETIVYRDGPSFTTPPTAAAGFVGYDEEDENLTVCGNCHVGQQGQWEETAHAEAWETLQGSGHSEAFCENCHTVNQLGNGAAGEGGGWAATKDTRYHDVQCESCHGPGLTHIQNPDASVPLAPLAVGQDLEIGCGECHNGTHHPYVEEWELSGHSNVLASPAGRAECQGCHTGQGVLRAWGIQADYLEKEETADNHLPITCGVCHDPHSIDASAGGSVGVPAGSPNRGGQLRYRIDVPDEEQNLCMKCHHKRSQPDIDPVTVNSRGPHSPEGPLLLGENVGFWFSDTPVDNDRIVGTHGSEANPRLCAGCHVQRFEVTDEATGEFVFQSVGHLFEAIPCLDAQGVPTGSDDCAFEERTFRSCTQSGCHGSEQAARSAFNTVNTRIANLAAELKALVDQVRATEIRSNDGKWTSAEGADFNYQLAVFPGSPTHNPFMIEALLTASIREMRTRYNLAAVDPSLDLRNTLSEKKH